MDIPIYKLIKSGPIRFPIGYLSDREEDEEYITAKKIIGYNLLREETWRLELDCYVDTLEDAEKYVMQETRKLPEFQIWRQNLNKSIEECLRIFCFEERLMDKNIYFIGKEEEIKNKLLKQIQNNTSYRYVA
jgi:hypothetical protein